MAGGTGSLVTKGWAQLRLSVVDEKLQGGNAACLTLRDLETSIDKSVQEAKSMAALREIVLGPGGSMRRTLPSTGLTPSQQVDVLIEQATDPNILGRSYHGWCPWL